METSLIHKPIPQFVPYWDNKEKKAIQNVLDSDYLNESKQTREFESKFAEFVNAKYCVTCNNGTIALYMALLTQAEELSEQIIVPSYMGLFVANAIVQSNHSIIIHDVNTNGVLSEEKTIKNIFVVHANGRKSKNIDELEDCCQSISHHTKHKISCYSFATSKHMTTGGQGGAICCDNKYTYEKLLAIKDFGRTTRINGKVSDEYNSWGLNYKFTELQASFGLEQLKKLPKRLSRLKEINKIYQDNLNINYGIEFPDESPEWYIDAYVKNPQELINYLAKNNIGSKRVHKPIHMQEVYKNAYLNLLNSMFIYEHGIFLPSTTNLTDDQILYICRIIKDHLGAKY